VQTPSPPFLSTVVEDGILAALGLVLIVIALLQVRRWRARRAPIPSMKLPRPPSAPRRAPVPAGEGGGVPPSRTPP
jgi:hypothetical protein